MFKSLRSNLHSPESLEPDSKQPVNQPGCSKGNEVGIWISLPSLFPNSGSSRRKPKNRRTIRCQFIHIHKWFGPLPENNKFHLLFICFVIRILGIIGLLHQQIILGSYKLSRIHYHDSSKTIHPLIDQRSKYTFEFVLYRKRY